MRLTNTIKEQIVKAAIEKAGFHKREEGIIKRRAAWAENVRIHALGGEGNAKKMESLAEQVKALANEIPANLCLTSKMLRRDNEVRYVNVAGLRARAWFSGYEIGGTGEESEMRITPQECVIHADNPLAKEFHEIAGLQAEYDSEMERLELSVRGALAKVTTVKKLLQVWPEAAELIPLVAAKEVKQLPAIPVDDLNKMIGLPTGE